MSTLDGIKKPAPVSEGIKKRVVWFGAVKKRIVDLWTTPLNMRTVTLAIAILSTLATWLSSITADDSAFHITNSQALLISSIGAGLYAIVRALQKAGAAPMKSIFGTSEAKGVAIVYLLAIVKAASGVVPPAWAGGMAAIATGLTLLARSLPLGSDGPKLPPAAVGAILLSLGLAASAPVSAAPKVQLGGCSDSGALCWQPAVAVSAFQLNLATMDYERVALGAGYGLVYKFLPVNLGVAGYLGAGISKKSPNAPQLNLLFSVADLGAIGPGLQVYKDPETGKLACQWLGSIALNLNIGGTTTYVERLIDTYERSVPAETVAVKHTPTTPPDAGATTPPDAGPDTILSDAGAYVDHSEVL